VSPKRLRVPAQLRRCPRQQWLKTLFVFADQPARFLSAETERHGIEVVRVAEDQLLPFLGEARDGFKEHFGVRGAQ